MSTAWKDKSGWYYQYTQIRAALLEQNQMTNGGRCVLAIEGVCTTTATQVHHVLGVGVDRLNPAYMVPACRACNYKLGDPSKHSPPHTGTTLFE